MKTLAVLFGCMLAASPALAVPAINCHCFQERSFDPDRPAVADPYFLATVQNSLFAAVFQVEKKVVVRAKMSGASGAELWVSHFLAARGGITLQQVAQARERKLSWRETLPAVGIGPDQLPIAFAKALLNGADTGALASLAVDEILQSRFGGNPAELNKLRKAGASDQEAILAVFLGRKTGRSAVLVFAAVAKEGKSWGSLLNEAAVNSNTVDGEIRRLVR